MDLSELNNAQIATIGVAHLGGDTKAIDTEDIAIKVSKITPKRFCWRKYPDRIDLHVVRVALADAKRVTPPLLVGGIKDGWMLSSEGLKWVSSLPDNLDEDKGAKRDSVSAVLEAERVRLHRTVAFTKFHSGNLLGISLVDFYDFVRINEYFPDRNRRERLAAVENAALGDPELVPLWDYLKSKFSKEVIPDEE